MYIDVIIVTINCEIMMKSVFPGPPTLITYLSNKPAFFIIF